MSLKDEIAAARARAGLPPLDEHRRRRQKNPRPRFSLYREPKPKPQAKAADAIAKAAVATPPRPAIAGEKWTGIPNDILDNVLRTLDVTDQAVLLRLYRLTWGFQKDWCEVSAQTLAKACNISKRQVGVSTSRLVAKGLILRLQTHRTAPAKYKMLLPPAIAKTAVAVDAIAESADNKDKALKKKDIKSAKVPDEHMTPEEVRELMSKLESGESV